MKIAIIGTGGVGGYFGGKLAKAGYDVTFLARGEHLSAIQHKGLTVKSILGDFTIDTVKVTDTIAAFGLTDLVILGVKAWQVSDISKELSAIIKKDTTVLPLQNGAVVRLGEKYGVDTPVNRFVYISILPMENKARKKNT
jgi:2-dehydropantoate 2-reductase